MQSKQANTVVQGRFNIYNFPHKGLRAMMQHTLYAVGRCDWSDAAETDGVLSEVRAMMEMMYGHLHHENEFVHAAMEARAPGSASQAMVEHEEHVLAIKSLLTDVMEIEAAPTGGRNALGYRLYTRMALFVAENLEHMVMEEVDHNAILWAHYTDDEIMDVDRRLVASIPPERAGDLLRWMIPAVSAGERAVFLQGARGGMPAEAFEGILAQIRTLLSAREWAKLMAALDSPEHALAAA